MAHLKNHVSSLDEGIPIFDENFRINKNVFDAFCRICRNTLARKDLIKDISKLFGFFGIVLFWIICTTSLS